MQQSIARLRVFRGLTASGILLAWLLAGCSSGRTSSPAVVPTTAPAAAVATITLTVTVQTTAQPTNSPTVEPPTAIFQSTNTPTLLASAQTTTSDGVVNHGGNLRGEPEVRAENVIGQVCPEDTLTLLAQRGIWYQVRVETTPQSCDPARVAVGTIGWLSASLITRTNTAPVQPGNPTLPVSTKAPTAVVTQVPTAAATKAPTAPATVLPSTASPTAAPAASRGDPSYPDVCIPPSPPDLDCGDIAYRRFRVVGNDPHKLDGDNDGIGCESG